MTSVMPEQEAVVKEYSKLTQSYLDNGQISQADMQALNDLTASLTDAPLVKVSEELAKIQTAYEETVSKI
jgi:hypothetical protein